MRPLKHLFLALFACTLLLAGKSADLKEYAGEEISSEEGIVVIRVVRRQSEGGVSKTLKQDYKVLTAVIKSVDGKRRMTIDDVDKIRAIVLPAGRWYVAELRTVAERDLPPVAKQFQNFEVLGGMINYAGLYTVSFEQDSNGKPSSNVEVTYDQDLVAEAAEAFPDAFAAKPLMYCPVGRKCKTPGEFKH